MFSYNQKDRTTFNSSESLKLSGSPNSFYSTSFSRTSTPVNSCTPATTAHNTPVNLKEFNSYQLNNMSSGNLPGINVSESNKPTSPIDLEKYIGNLTEDTQQTSFRTTSPFHLSSSIWDTRAQDVLDAKPRHHQLPKNSLTIDIGTANTTKVANPIRSAFVPSTNSNLGVQTVEHRRKLSSDSIWGQSYTSSAEYFGNNVSHNDINSLNNGINFLNLKPQAEQSHLKSPLTSFSHKFNTSQDMMSPARSNFVSNSSVPRTNNFFEPQPQMSQPQPMSAATMNQIAGYFAKAEDSNIQQLTLDYLKNLNYEKVFASKAGQLPRFLLPGQDANSASDQYANSFQNNKQLVLVAFKNGRLDIFYYVLDQASKMLQINDLVFVEADRGKDLGMVVSTDISIDDARLIKMLQSEEQADALKFANDDKASASAPQPHIPKQVLRVAMPHDVSQILHKQSDEVKALQIMQSKLVTHKVPMKVLGAEYQWDRRKLTFYYVANKRIDFRDLVKDIFRIYKTRIWMCAVSPLDMSIKNTIVEQPQFAQLPQFLFPEQQLQPAFKHQQHESTSSVGSDFLNVNQGQFYNNGNYSYTPVTEGFAINLQVSTPHRQTHSQSGMMKYNDLTTGAWGHD